MDKLKFKAIRINGTAYVELFEGDRCLAVILESHALSKEEWNRLYDAAVLEADRLNHLMAYSLVAP